MCCLLSCWDALSTATCDSVFKTGLQLCSPHSRPSLRRRRRYFKSSGQLLFTCISCFVPVFPLNCTEEADILDMAERPPASVSLIASD